MVTIDINEHIQGKTFPSHALLIDQEKYAWNKQIQPIHFLKSPQWSSHWATPKGNSLFIPYLAGSNCLFPRILANFMLEITISINHKPYSTTSHENLSTIIPQESLKTFTIFNQPIPATTQYSSFRHSSLNTNHFWTVASWRPKIGTPFRPRFASFTCDVPATKLALRPSFRGTRPRQWEPAASSRGAPGVMAG